MENIKSRQELAETLEESWGSDNGHYFADGNLFRAVTGSNDPAEWKVWVAAQRANGVNVESYDLYRFHRETGGFLHVNLFRFRDTKRKGVMIPFYGPNLQTTQNAQATKRRRGNKESNYEILSLLYHGSRFKSLVCMDCEEPLLNRILKGYRLGMRGDFHHAVVFKNKSFHKGSTDPSKRLENTKLHNGSSDVAMDCILDFMGCIPFCKVCHADWHQMFAQRARNTKHSDIRDYEGNQRPYFIRSKRNYDRVTTILKIRYGYNVFPSYEEWLEKLHLPDHINVKWS